MKNQQFADRLLRCFAVLTFVVNVCLGQAQLPKLSGEESRVAGIFTARVQQYLKLRTGLEASMPTLKPTNEAARIAEHQHTLANNVVQARLNARQGDIFTPEVTRYFLAIIRSEFQGPNSRVAQETKRQNDPEKPIVQLRVNDIYPAESPLTAMPPALLQKLPQLPKEMAYRIVGRDLTLKDTKAELIVDFIPKALP